MRSFSETSSFRKVSTQVREVYICGVSKGNKGYYFYNRFENKVFVARNSVFSEKQIISTENSGSKVLLEEVKEPQITVEDRNEIQDDSQDVVESESVTQGLRRFGRSCHEPERYRFYITDDERIVLVDHNEPTTYQEAIVDPNSIRWREAMKSEMQSMFDNQV